MDSQNHLKKLIQYAKQRIQSLQTRLELTLLGEYIYVIDEEDPIYAYKLEREHFSNYTKLPFDKKQEYAETHAQITQEYYKLACLYQKARNYSNAINYHFNAIQRGRIEIIFTAEKTYISRGEKPLFENKLSQALAYLLGIGCRKNYSKAFSLLMGSIEEHPKECNLLLGIMTYYGLGRKPDHGVAKHYFYAAYKAGCALGSQYLGLCEMENAQLWRARAHMKRAVRACLPQAQIAMGLMQQQHYGMFFKWPGKADENLYLANIQRPYFRSFKNQPPENISSNECIALENMLDSTAP